MSNYQSHMSEVQIQLRKHCLSENTSTNYTLVRGLLHKFV